MTRDRADTRQGSRVTLVSLSLVTGHSAFRELEHHLPAPGLHSSAPELPGEFRIRESFRLENTLGIIKSCC